MKTLADLQTHLRRLDGKGYKAYKAVAGSYDAGSFVLHIDHVQGDPFADPSRVRAVLAPDSAQLPEWALSTPARRVSVADFLNRVLSERAREPRKRQGTGRSGEIGVLRPGQQVLRRTAVVVREGGEVEARFTVGLPANGRRILGRYAAELVGESVPAVVEAALRFASLDADTLRTHVETVEDTQALRDALASHQLVAFVGDGARLPRASGIDDRPLESDGVVTFEAPDSLAVELERPNAGPIRGLGIRTGVTLIVGGGFHGKSTLLHAIERGIYDHIPSDGRELVATRTDAVKVRAEDGRAITGVDISPFISDLPGGQTTSDFATDNASGSTSQAAAISEALELGTHCLLMDEDTSATNFMIRDARMQALIADELEPITPFIDRARALLPEVSTVLVVGGSGDYFDIADVVIAMQHYRALDVTERAHEVAHEQPTQRASVEAEVRAPRARRLDAKSLRPSKGKREVHIKVPTDDRVVFGTQEVRLGALEQVVEVAQMRAVAEALAFARAEGLFSNHTIAEALTRLRERIERDGLEVVQRRLAGNLSDFRTFEAAAFLNRLRKLAVAVD